MAKLEKNDLRVEFLAIVCLVFSVDTIITIFNNNYR